MARSMVAVVGGYVIFSLSSVLLFQLTGHDPHVRPPAGFGVFAITYGVGFAALGGYVAAAAARHSELLHAAVVAGVIALLAGLSLAAQPSGASVWSEIAVLALMAPAAVGGGYLRRRSRRGRPFGR